MTGLCRGAVVEEDVLRGCTVEEVELNHEERTVEGARTTQLKDRTVGVEVETNEVDTTVLEEVPVDSMEHKVEAKTNVVDTTVLEEVPKSSMEHEPRDDGHNGGVRVP